MPRFTLLLSLLVSCAVGTTACEIAGIGEDDEEPYELVVTQRAGTTLTVSWDAMPNAAQGYTVDYLSFATCVGLPEHGDVKRVTGLQTEITGLTPSTDYNIHVHSLPHSSAGQSTNRVLVRTLAAGAAPAAVTAADYQRC